MPNVAALRAMVSKGDSANCSERMPWHIYVLILKMTGAAVISDTKYIKSPTPRFVAASPVILNLASMSILAYPPLLNISVISLLAH